MAAHSPSSPIVPSVPPDQPPAAYPQWLREMAQAINLIAAKLEDIETRLVALEPP